MLQPPAGISVAAAVQECVWTHGSESLRELHNAVCA